MEFDPQKIAETFAALRRRAGLSMADMAKAMEFKGASSYQRYEDAATYEKGFADPKVIRRAEAALVGKGTPPILLAELWELAGPEFQPPSPERTRGQIVRSVEPNVISNERWGLVYSGAQGGNGKLIVSSEPIDRVKLPAFLENVVGAYGMLIDGESMIPEYWPGDTAWVNPHLRPARGKNAILYHTPPGGEEAEAIIKRVNGWNDREWDLEQWNPALKFKEFRREWPIYHRVVGKYDAA